MSGSRVAAMQLLNDPAYNEFIKTAPAYNSVQDYLALHNVWHDSGRPLTFECLQQIELAKQGANGFWIWVPWQRQIVEQFVMIPWE